MEDPPQTDNGTLASAALVTGPAWGPKARGGASTEQAEAKWYPVTKVRGNGGRAEKYTHCTWGQSCRVHVMVGITQASFLDKLSVFRLTRVPFLSTALLYTLILHAPQLSSPLFCVHSWVLPYIHPSLSSIILLHFSYLLFSQVPYDFISARTTSQYMTSSSKVSTRIILACNVTP